MTHENKSIQMIADYLIEQEKNDQQLRDAIINMEHNKKSLDQMWEYIVGCAKDELNGKSGAISDTMVFGWAIHYFTEPNEILFEKIKPVAEKQNTSKIQASGSLEKKENKAIKVKPSYINAKQLSLFED